MKKTFLTHFGLVVTLASLLAGCTGMNAALVRASATVASSPSPGATGTPSPVPSATAAQPVAWAPWPSIAWSTATPEQVGMDSERLLTLLDFLEQQDLELHSLLIVRRGYLVFDLNLYPSTAATPQEIQSATKSVTSALYGMALQDGTIKSLDQSVLSFFPKRVVANLDTRKEDITLRDLLTMTSGLDWPEASISYASRDNPVRAMFTSNDPVQYVLDRPMVATPGTTFNYNTGNSQLLGAILEEASGETLSAYADRNLFEPLGIHTYTWQRIHGSESGGSGLALTPRDMAKLGYLYLRGGLWAGQQLLPASWIAQSTVSRIAAPSGGYGYQWWINSNGGYSALGFGGQAIQVYPADDLVVVATGAMNAAQRTTLHNLEQYFVLPAVVSNTSLPPVEGSATLKARLQAAAAPPAAQDPPALPGLAAQIAGQTYALDINALNWKSIKLEFASKSDAALTVEYTTGGSARIPIGLDGVPRVAQGLRTAVVGEWDDEQTFTMKYETLGSADGETIDMAFAGKEVKVTVTSYVQGDVSHIKGESK